MPRNAEPFFTAQMGLIATVQCNSCRDRLQVNGATGKNEARAKVRKFYAVL